MRPRASLASTRADSKSCADRLAGMCSKNWRWVFIDILQKIDFARGDIVHRAHHRNSALVEQVENCPTLLKDRGDGAQDVLSCNVVDEICPFR